VPGNAPLQSVTRACHALELACNRRKGITLSNIATGLQVGKQTAHHIVRTLIQEGFLEKVGTPPLYRAGPMLDSLARHREDWNRRVLLPAVPVAIGLAKKTKANIYVGQYVGGMVIGRFLVPGWDGGDPRFTFGWRFTPYGSALGYVAFLQPEEVKDYVNHHGFAPNDRIYWGSVGQLLAFAEAIRQQGHMTIVKSGNFRASAPVFDADGSVVSLIAAVAPFVSLASGQAQTCVQSVRSAADKLTAALRFHDASTQATPARQSHRGTVMP